MNNGRGSEYKTNFFIISTFYFGIFQSLLLCNFYTIFCLIIFFFFDNYRTAHHSSFGQFICPRTTISTCAKLLENFPPKLDLAIEYLGSVALGQFHYWESMEGSPASMAGRC